MEPITLGILAAIAVATFVVDRTLTRRARAAKPGSAPVSGPAFVPSGGIPTYTGTAPVPAPTSDSAPVLNDATVRAAMPAAAAYAAALQASTDSARPYLATLAVRTAAVRGASGSALVVAVQALQSAVHDAEARRGDLRNVLGQSGPSDALRAALAGAVSLPMQSAGQSVLATVDTARGAAQALAGQFDADISAAQALASTASASALAAEQRRAAELAALNSERSQLQAQSTAAQAERTRLAGMLPSLYHERAGHFRAAVGDLGMGTGSVARLLGYQLSADGSEETDASEEGSGVSFRPDPSCDDVLASLWASQSNPYTSPSLFSFDRAVFAFGAEGFSAHQGTLRALANTEGTTRTIRCIRGRIEELDSTLAALAASIRAKDLEIHRAQGSAGGNIVMRILGFGGFGRVQSGSGLSVAINSETSGLFGR